MSPEKLPGASQALGCCGRGREGRSSERETLGVGRAAAALGGLVSAGGVASFGAEGDNPRFSASESQPGSPRGTSTLGSAGRATMGSDTGGRLDTAGSAGCGGVSAPSKSANESQLGLGFESDM